MAAKLTPKQQRFVDEYLVDLNGTKAAIRAGYSKKAARQIASETLSKPYIQEAVAKAQQARARRVGIDRDWVIRQLVMVAKRCMQHEPATDAAGNVVGNYTFNAAVALAALHAIGKHLGMYANRRAAEVKRFKDMTEVELLGLIGEIDDGLGGAGTA